MLDTLTIKNIAVIDSAEIQFKKGLNVLSGETGAGKSIVLEAISLILGSRANTELIRAGCDEAVVEGLFNLDELDWIQNRLENLGFKTDGDGRDLLIKRVVNRSGRHRIHINGELATLSILQELCEGLIDLCGQHEHQTLTKSATQLELLDRYGTLEALRGDYARIFEKARSLRREREELLQADAERTRRADFLKFQIDELTAAQLAAGEDEELQKEKILLQSAESRVLSGEAARQILEEDEKGTLNSLRLAHSKMRALAQTDERASPMLEALERALAETEEATLSLHRYLGGVDLNPERLEQVQDRLSLIADLRRKYGASVAEMLATLTRVEAEYATLEQTGEKIDALSAELETAEAELRKTGRKLSSARKKAAELLADSVTAELHDLKMSDARFAIELAPKEEIGDWTATGADQIHFLVQTNKGEAQRPLGKIASGGELSRLMLAIRRVIADKGGIGVYLFDEIDAGIGGQTAFQVGKKLKSVAAYNQVLCITHLPQVASFADHHLVVRKTTSAKRTVTEVVALTKASERKEELARMLGGPELTKKSLENAAELLQLAR
ncbi:MAG: DNA repair protein RecN [Oligoflexia bacterium]|nr:DNA repair protein RecN [Oligoflexia bacterium]